jgi:serine/threonine protein kinase/tetratricopeptide (TPR) repeat protein
MIGQTVSHYKITSKLGSGGMGVVYEAEDTKLGRHVAIKFLPVDMAQNPAMLERFQREARASSALNHPGICTVYEIDQHEGQHFIVMELLEGETLDKRLRRETLELGALLEFGIQVADALESASAKGIVHRDLKPANIWLTSRGQAKILDFGLAKMETSRPGGAPVNLDEPTAAQAGDLTTAGMVVGTASYMSPEQARGQTTDARTDIFSLGVVLYVAATGEKPFNGETTAVITEAILNREPVPIQQLDPALPAELNRIVLRAMEKERSMRYQTATDFKTDLLRLRRDTQSGARNAADRSDSKPGSKGGEKSIAVLYFENLSGVKEDEYFRDGVTEDIITELSKIKGLKVLSRPSVLVYRDKSVTAAEVGRQLKASFVLAGSIRRGGNRLRITAQLVDPQTDSVVWSERYDREMADVFSVQDEIARNIAEALRITLSPQEQEALAKRPTESPEAYDLYLRGRTYARRFTRLDLEFAYQMFENAVRLDPKFALAYGAMANVCSSFHINFERDSHWLTRAREAAEKAIALSPDLPDAKVAQGWVLYASGDYEKALDIARALVALKRDTESAYYLLLRALFAAGKYQEIVNVAEAAIEASGTDYNVYVPIGNALGALGKEDARKNHSQRRLHALETHLRQVPEDARAHMLLAGDYGYNGRVEEAMKEADLAMVLRPNDANVAYNAACVYCSIGKVSEAMAALRKAKTVGWKDTVWTRRDPDLAILHGDPEFDRLFPPGEGG